MITQQQLEVIARQDEPSGYDTAQYVASTWGIDIGQCDSVTARIIDKFVQYGASNAIMQILSEEKNKQL